MESLIKTFYIDWKLLIAQIINFGIVLFVLWKFAINPLSKMMDKRTLEIEKSLKDAKKIEENLEKIEKEREAKILTAKKEAQEIITRARQQGQSQGQQMVDEAKKEIENIIATAKEQISQERSQMLKSVKSEISELVVQSTKKILEKTGTKEIDGKIIKESLIHIQK
jgi:F-type H+-transporting ATPase subunit b